VLFARQSCGLQIVAAIAGPPPEEPAKFVSPLRRTDQKQALGSARETGIKKARAMHEAPPDEFYLQSLIFIAQDARPEFAASPARARRATLYTAGMAETAIVERTAVVRHGRRLEYFTIAWNALEGLVAVVAGAIAGSISLVGFESIASSK